MKSNFSESSSSHNTLINKLRANLNNDVQLKTSQEYRDLSTFLDEYKSNDSKETNIIDQGRKIAYSIPEKRLPQFFELLEKCRNGKLEISFSEKQFEPSGIMLDFDILQETDKSQLEDSHFYSLTRQIIELLSNILIFNEDKIVTYVMILRKTKTEYKEECKKVSY